MDDLRLPDRAWSKLRKKQIGSRTLRVQGDRFVVHWERGSGRRNRLWASMCAR